MHRNVRLPSTGIAKFLPLASFCSAVVGFSLDSMSNRLYEGGIMKPNRSKTNHDTFRRRTQDCPTFKLRYVHTDSPCERRCGFLLGNGRATGRLRDRPTRARRAEKKNCQELRARAERYRAYARPRRPFRFY